MKFQFGEKALEDAYKIVKQTIQHPHIYKKINKSTIRLADSYASSRWFRAMDYYQLIKNLGVEIIEE